MTWTCGSLSRERRCGRWPKSSGKTPAAHPIRWRPRWKIRRRRERAFASSVPSTSAPELSSSGIASSFRPLRKIAAPMAETSSWVCAVRRTDCSQPSPHMPKRRRRRLHLSDPKRISPHRGVRKTEKCWPWRRSYRQAQTSSGLTQLTHPQVPIKPGETFRVRHRCWARFWFNANLP